MTRNFIILFVAAICFVGVNSFPAGGDFGELLGSVCSDGIPHPPGYPLWSLIHRAWLFLTTWIPIFPSETLAANFLNAGFFVSALLIGIRLPQFPRWEIRDLVGPLIFLSSFQVLYFVWTSEVFALQALLLVLLFSVAQKVLREANLINSTFFGLLLGLNTSHHHTSVFFMVPLGILFLSRAPKKGHQPWRYFFGLCLGGIVGVLPYAYLLSADPSASVTWGDLTTLNGFADHFLRRDYGTFQLGTDLLSDAKQTLWEKALRIGEGLIAGLGWIGTALFVYVAYRLIKKSTANWQQMTMFVALGAYLGFFIFLTNYSLQDDLMFWVVRRFLIIPLFVLSLACGFGARHFLSQKASVAVVILLTTILVARLGLHWREVRNHGEIYSKVVLELQESVPPKSILMTQGDVPSNISKHAIACEGRLSQIEILDLYLATYPWYFPFKRTGMAVPFSHLGADNGKAKLSNLVRANSHLTFSYWGPARGRSPTDFEKHFKLIPESMVYRVSSRTGEAMFEQLNRPLLSKIKPLIELVRFHEPSRQSIDRWERLLWNHLNQMLVENFAWLSQRGLDRQQQAEWMETIDRTSPLLQHSVDFLLLRKMQLELQGSFPQANQVYQTYLQTIRAKGLDELKVERD